MDRMLYVAMSGAREIQLAQASNSNNLANANTPGFLEDLNQFRSMPVFGPGHPTRVYALAERPEVGFDRGAIQRTGNDLDVAVAGDGLIAVQGPDGQEAYTRRGDLRVDPNGLLVNGAGWQLVGDNGPIALPPDEKIEIGADGTITLKPVGATPEALAILDRIKLVKPANAELVKGDDGLLRLRDGGQAPADAGARLERGTLESSNVSVVESLVDMIELSRKYELQVKMMKTAKELDAKAATLLQLGG